MIQQQHTLKYTRIGAFLWFGGYQVAGAFVYQTSITGYEAKGELYQLDTEGMLSCEKHYAWDGPTGGIKTRDFVLGSLIHDILCEMINNGLLPPKLQCMADQEMLVCNKSQDMIAIRRALTFAAVTLHMQTKKKSYVPKVYEVTW